MIRALVAWLMAALFSAALPAAAQWKDWDYDLDQEKKPWDEMHTQLPPYPKAENLLRYQDERLQTIFKNTPEAIINIGFKGEILEINPTGLRLLQVDSHKKLHKKDIFDFIHKEDLRRFKKFHNSVGIGNHKTDRFRIVSSKNEERWIESNAVPLLDQEKHVISVLTINHDITEQQKAYEEIYFQAKLLENVFDPIISFDNNRRILSWNQGAEKLLGWKSKEALGKVITELIRSEILNGSLEDAFRSLDETGFWSGQLHLTAKNGNRLIVAANSSRLKNEQHEVFGTIVTYRDITERKLAETLLKESQMRLTSGQEIANIGYWDRDFLTQKGIWSKQMYKIFERPESDEAPATDEFIKDVHPDDRNSLIRVQQDLLKSTGKIIHHYRLLLKDGKIKNILAISLLLKDDKDIPYKMMGTTMDVTELEEAKEKALINERRFQELFEHSPDAIYVEDEKGYILDVNEVACRMQGYNKEELVGKNITKFTPDILQENILSRFELYFSQDGAILETQIWDKNWNSIPVELKTSRITFNNKPAVLIHARDISKRINAEKDKRETELKFDVLSDHAPVGIYQVDTKGKFVRTNRKFLEIFELTMEQVQSEEWIKRIHPDDASRFMKLLDETRGKSKELELHYKLLIDGKIKYVFGKSNALFNNEGEVIGRIGTILNLTEDRKTIQQMMFTQSMFQNIFEHSPEPIFIEDLQGNILNANLKACKLYGLNYDELIGKNIFDLTPADHREKMKLEFENLCDGSSQRINSLSWNKEGLEIPVQKRANLINYFDKVAVLIHMLPR